MYERGVFAAYLELEVAVWTDLSRPPAKQARVVVLKPLPVGIVGTTASLAAWRHAVPARVDIGVVGVKTPSGTISVLRRIRVAVVALRDALASLLREHLHSHVGHGCPEDDAALGLDTASCGPTGALFHHVGGAGGEEGGGENGNEDRNELVHGG